MRWRFRLSEYTFDMVYKPGASHHFPDLLSRASTVAPPEDIHDDIPCLTLAETANGIRTARYTSTDTSKPVNVEDVVEAQQTDDSCVEMSTRGFRIMIRIKHSSVSSGFALAATSYVHQSFLKEPEHAVSIPAGSSVLLSHSMAKTFRRIYPDISGYIPDSAEQPGF